MMLALALVAAVNPITVTSRGEVSAVVRPHGTTAAVLTLVFTPVSADRYLAVATAVRTETKADVPVSVELPEGNWTVDVESPVTWHARQYVFVTAGTTTSVVADVWPGSTVTGTIANGTKLPPTLSVRFESVPSPQKTSMSGEIRCPITDGVFKYALPAGSFNLRLRPPGFIAQYRPNLGLLPGEALSLGAFEFREGQSVTGRIEMPANFKGDLREVTVTATPAGADAAGVVERSRMLVSAGTVERNGFFHIDGVAPGQFVVNARYRRSLYSERVPVEVRPTREAELIQPLRLHRPYTIAVSISPPVASDSKPWHVRLSKQVTSSHTEAVSESNASMLGAWQSPPLQPGHYVFTVGDEHNLFHTEEVEIDARDEVIGVSIETADVEGTVRIGDDPLEAALTFMSSGATIHTKSDASGKFAVAIPTSRDTSLDVRIEAEMPRVHRTLKVAMPHGANMTIALPRSVVTGSVVDVTGAAVGDATIVITKGDATEPFIQTDTEADGTFATYALPDGTYSVIASAYMRESAPVALEVRDGETPQPLRLVVHEMTKVRGRVLSPYGSVAGATVQADAVDVEQLMLIRLPTDANGEFMMPAPAGTHAVDLLIAPAGFSYVLMGARVTPRPIIVNVDQRGGTLTVRAQRDAIPHIVHGGGTAPVTMIGFTWPMRIDERPGDAGRDFILPMMEPGAYAACLVEPTNELAFRRSGGQTGGHCVSGTLAPFSTLTLDLRER